MPCCPDHFNLASCSLGELHIQNGRVFSGTVIVILNHILQATDVHELLSALQAHTERGREEAAEIRPGPRRRAGGPGDAAAVPGSPGPSSREDGGTSRNSARSKGVMYPVPREERPGPGAAAATFPAGERGYPGNQPQEEVVSPGMEFILGLYERLQAGQTLEEASGHRGATVLSSADTVRTFAAAGETRKRCFFVGGGLKTDIVFVWSKEPNLVLF